MNLLNKKILLRVDLNAPVEKGKIIPTERFEAHAETIKLLSGKGAKIILLAHQGRKGEKDYLDSLCQHAIILSKLCNKKIKYVNDLYGKTAKSVIEKMNSGEIILLKNARSMKNETNEKMNHSETAFVKTLSKIADIFVLDAFSVAHRDHASVTGFVNSIPCFQGPNLSKEIESLKTLSRPEKPFTMILCGAKIDEIRTLMQNLGKKANYILLYGALGEAVVRSRGVNFGKKNEFLDTYDYSQINLNEHNIILPKDFVLENRKTIRISDLPTKLLTKDIGKETIKEARSIIKKSKTILMKGPAGFTEEGFVQGTKAILKAIKESKAESIIGGGHLTTAIKELKFKNTDFTHVSLGGGSLVEFLSGRKLPGVEKIKDKLNIF